MKLTFVSSNKGKITEAQHILGFPISITKLPLVEIQSLNLEEIVQHKAEEAYRHVKKPLLVDDAGLFIDAWKDFPGPFIKFIYEAGGSDLLLQMMQAETNRKAYFKATIGYHDGKNIHIFSGSVTGNLLREKRGKHGWGFDPIFQPDGYKKSFSEMTTKEKNAVSHRKMALEKLKNYFKSH